MNQDLIGGVLLGLALGVGILGAWYGIQDRRARKETERVRTRQMAAAANRAKRDRVAGTIRNGVHEAPVFWEAEATAAASQGDVESAYAHMATAAILSVHEAMERNLRAEILRQESVVEETLRDTVAATETLEELRQDLTRAAGDYPSAYTYKRKEHRA